MGVVSLLIGEDLVAIKSALCMERLTDLPMIFSKECGKTRDVKEAENEEQKNVSFFKDTIFAI